MSLDHCKKQSTIRLEAIRKLEYRYPHIMLYGSILNSNTIEIFDTGNKTLYLPFVVKHKGYSFKLQLFSL